VVAEGVAVVEATPLLRISKLSKTFGTTRVLDDVSLDVGSGEIVAVVGQNGSGKSTLVKVLAGIHPSDPGAVVEVRERSGAMVPLRSVHDRLHFIHQDLGLLPMLSTTENLDLGLPLGRRWITPTHHADEHRRAARSVARFGIDIDVRAPVGTLSPAERAIVAIARALDGWRRPDNVLVLDEPTTAFHQDEVARLFEAVRRVVDAGAGAIFISHRLDEVRGIADRVVALRDGRKVAEASTADLDEDSLVRAIVGTSVDRRYASAAPGPKAKTTLSVEALTGRLLRDVALQVKAGEVVGVTGVLGSGREELAALVFGEQRPRGGTVRVGDRTLDPGNPVDAIAHGVAYVPADRLRCGALATMSATENLTLSSLRPLRRRLGRVDRRAERAEAARWTSAVGLHPARPERRLATFSGGNQQKVVLARCLRTEPRLLLLDEPTQGVDIGAKATIHDLVSRAAGTGTAVLVASSDTKELASMCHRVLVVHAGRITAEITGAELSEATLVRETLTAAGTTGGER
jgi:ABC-type sugar transport system ATPase subunit